MAAATNKVSLKLLIDKKSNKVLFAEAGKDFVDFVLNLLSLPIGTVIRLLKTEAMVGCIANLHHSLENLDEAYMQPNQSKDSLLKPRVPMQHLAHHLPLLLPEIDQLKIYACSYDSKHPFVTYLKGAPCVNCNFEMTRELQFVDSMKNSSSSPSAGAANKDSAMPGDYREGGYVKGLVTYMVTDDLSVSPLSMISGVALLNKFSAKGFSSLEEKMVEFGTDEGVELLKASLQTKAALNRVFLTKHEVTDAATLD